MKRPALAGALLVAMAAPGAAGGLAFDLRLGYQSGEFGTGIETRLATAVAAFEVGSRVRLRLELPFHEGEIPNTVVLTHLGVSPRVRREVNAGLVDLRRDASGIGDLRASLAGDLAGGGARLFRLGGELELKAPTADEADGLGTGEWDLRLGLTGEREGLRGAAFAGAGWSRLGDPRGLELEDPLDGFLGVESEPLRRGVRLAAWLEGHQEAVAGAGDRLAAAVAAGGSGRMAWYTVAKAGLTRAAEEFSLEAGLTLRPQPLRRLR